MLSKRRFLNLKWSLLFFLGPVFGVPREKLAPKFIEENNAGVLQEGDCFKGEELLILAPHCLQKDSCLHKITRHLENCQQCGGCKIGDLKALQQKYNCRLDVATGGTLARQIIKQYRPKGIVAIACERDLVSGVMDVYPLPVIGVLNRRPFGPCFNTDVDLELVEQGLKSFTGEVHG